MNATKSDQSESRFEPGSRWAKAEERLNRHAAVMAARGGDPDINNKIDHDEAPEGGEELDEGYGGADPYGRDPWDVVPASAHEQSGA